MIDDGAMADHVFDFFYIARQTSGLSVEIDS